jgi:rhodanese-related sulfurtransferase
MDGSSPSFFLSLGGNVMSEIQSVSVQQLAEMNAKAHVELIDVRSPVEFREVHIAQARNVPLDRFDPRQIVKDRAGGSDQPVFLVCKSGGRASKAAKKFIDAGILNAFLVEGGTDAWIAAELPVVRGKKAVSIERQVRIVAGGLAALGAFAALLTGNVWWGILPAFIGSGLVFAGVTDTCMMAEVLARMPWNSVTSASCKIES